MILVFVAVILLLLVVRVTRVYALGAAATPTTTPTVLTDGQKQDHTPPSLSVDIPLGGLVTNFGALYVHGRANDAYTKVDRVSYSVEEVDGIAGNVTRELYSDDATGTDSWEFHVLYLPSGYYRVSIHAYDGAGNHRTQRYDIQVDTTKPELQLETPSETDSIQNHDFTVTPAVVDSETDIEAIRTELYSGEARTNYQPVCTQLPEDTTLHSLRASCPIDVDQLAGGEYTLRFQGIDAAKNQSQTVEWHFRIISGTIELHEG